MFAYLDMYSNKSEYAGIKYACYANTKSRNYERGQSTYIAKINKIGEIEPVN